ncbi:Der GTPase-activating protein YihI [Vibrio zhugei]|uniref:Der GTPase-activating protein YihI n=1 Tax=Vibrio zhugei TaxID=2479546 RepID=A0ABV7CEN0_9VIBR|nr:Der GTPase-activating protein YihI [Vibrio zhugei]
MSRSKKSRKPGVNSSAELIVTRNRSEADQEGRLRKRLKKRKGLKTGQRHSVAQEEQMKKGAQKRDSRLGSKKKIPLIVETPKKQSKQERRVSAAQELEMLENDAQLAVLMTRLENGEKLGVGLQKYVDDKLDRIEILMDQLGLFDEDDEVDETPQVPETSSKKASKPKSDDDLLSQFQDIDVDSYK